MKIEGRTFVVSGGYVIYCPPYELHRLVDLFKTEPPGLAKRVWRRSVEMEAMPPF